MSYLLSDKATSRDAYASKKSAVGGCLGGLHYLATLWLNLQVFTNNTLQQSSQCLLGGPAIPDSAQCSGN